MCLVNVFLFVVLFLEHPVPALLAKWGGEGRKKRPKTMNIKALFLFFFFFRGAFPLVSPRPPRARNSWHFLPPTLRHTGVGFVRTDKGKKKGGGGKKGCGHLGKHVNAGKIVFIGRSLPSPPSPFRFYMEGSSFFPLCVPMPRISRPIPSSFFVNFTPFWEGLKGDSGVEKGAF